MWARTSRSSTAARSRPWRPSSSAPPQGQMFDPINTWRRRSRRDGNYPGISSGNYGKTNWEWFPLKFEKHSCELEKWSLTTTPALTPHGPQLGHGLKGTVQSFINHFWKLLFKLFCFRVRFGSEPMSILQDCVSECSLKEQYVLFL